MSSRRPQYHPPRRPIREQLSVSRRRAFLAFTAAFPVLAFFLLELSLRVLGYGPDLDLFIQQDVHGRTYHIMNPAVRHRYFTGMAFEPSTSPDYFLVPKPQGCYRIFCLGGSTTTGFPYWYNGAFSSFLRDRLRRSFPGRTIDVINLGMTATNSYTVVDMTRDLFRFEPDLLIVYDGHNEFYGALGAASRESMGGSRQLSRLALVLAHVRTYRLALDIAAAFRSVFGSEDDRVSRGTMMERLAKGNTVPYGSQTYHDALKNFTANLAELKDLCNTHGVPVVLGTQVCNLRGQVPFVSGMPPETPPNIRLSFNTRFNAGMGHWLNGDYAAALADYRAAAELLPGHAEAHYRVARTLDTLGRVAEALTEYVRARDLDELPFRATSDFNTAIRAMDDGIASFCADLEESVADASPGKIIGSDLMLDHLHPTAYGQFLMARTFVQAMRAHALLARTEEWRTADTLADDVLWRNRHLTPVDDRIAARRTEALVTAWPFQPDEMPLADVAPDDTLGQIADQFVYGQVHWKQAHENAAAYYMSQNNIEAREREYRTLISQLPYIERLSYHHLAQILADQQQTYEAAALLRTLLSMQPDYAPAVQLLADIEARMQ